MDMTRLSTDWIAGLVRELAAIDREYAPVSTGDVETGAG